MPQIARAKTGRRHAAAVPIASSSKKVLNTQPQEEEPVSMIASHYNVKPEQPVAEASNTKRHKMVARTQMIPSSTLEPMKPYSRSHMKRQKKKAKEQLAGGELSSVAAALKNITGDEDEEEEFDIVGKPRRKPKKTAEEKEKAKVEAAKIGEGKGKTLKEKARREQIKQSQTRLPAILKHPSFAANPWATIREHASNSVAQQETPEPVQKSKKKKQDAMDLE